MSGDYISTSLDQSQRGLYVAVFRILVFSGCVLLVYIMLPYLGTAQY